MSPFSMSNLQRLGATLKVPKLRTEIPLGVVSNCSLWYYIICFVKAYRFKGCQVKMSLTFQEVILDAKKLVIRISHHENMADHLISEIESVCGQINNMKQYQEKVEILNAEAKQKPRTELIAGIERENKYLRDVQAENKELRNALQDQQNALELIMSKYRQQTASLLRLNKTDLSSLYNSKYSSIITSQADKINEMAAVMKTAAALDEENELKEKEKYVSLQQENAVLRELVNIANKYGSMKNETPVESKSVQTEST